MYIIKKASAIPSGQTHDFLVGVVVVLDVENESETSGGGHYDEEERKITLGSETERTDDAQVSGIKNFPHPATLVSTAEAVHCFTWARCWPDESQCNEYPIPSFSHAYLIW